ncbi:MAG: threonine synthase [Rickettsiales bacterium]|jgi:threonine synthase|nr:threonine synthase [Rickettsiales bacterium]
MKYNSTRDKTILKNFTDIIISGTAADGGLYIPETIPHFKLDKNLTYIELATEITSLFTDIDKQIIRDCFEKAYKDFKNDIIPIEKLDNDLFLIKLYQGPTLSFKDYALRFLGQIVDYVLEQKKLKKQIITATSGDTGPAAIYGFKDSKNVSIKVYFPSKNVSKLQREQMLSIKQSNIEVVPIDADFDSCQKLVKDSFANDKDGNLMTVNSINMGRIIAQIVYYVYIYSKIPNPNFFVPTGNFGNICAGYLAKQILKDDSMKLSICVGENDTLHRFYQTGIYEPHKTINTPANAIDIANPSNFERILCYMSDVEDTKRYMTSLKENGKYEVSNALLKEFRKNFDVYRVSNAEIFETQKLILDKYKQKICPHTAVAFKSALSDSNAQNNKVIFATADPVKFE